MRLSGKNVIVVGASSSVGAACTKSFLENGANVLAVDRSAESLAHLSGPVEGQLHTLVADYRSTEGIHEIVNLCSGMWGAVDAFINCTGVLDHWDESDDSMERWAELFRTNLFAPVFLAKQLRPYLAKSGRGSIVFLGSVDGTRGNPVVPAYSASKAGLVPTTHVLAAAWATDNIRVNMVATGLIYHHGASDPVSSKPGIDFDKFMQATPLKRAPEPSEIAGAVLFLASDDSSYMTGTTLTVDGGRTAITPGTWSF